MLFLINVVIAVATLWNAWEDNGDARSTFKNAVGSARARAGRKWLLLWLVPVLSILAIPLTWRAETDAEGKIADAYKLAGQANREAAKANERASSNELAAAVANERAEYLELVRAEIEQQAAPRRLTLQQELYLTKEWSKATNSVVLVSASLDEECSDFADDFEVALRLAGWKVSRLEAPALSLSPLGMNAPGFKDWPLRRGVGAEFVRTFMMSKKLRGVVVLHNTHIESPVANQLLGALGPAKIGTLTDWQSPNFPTGVVWLVIGPKPPLGSERSFTPREFKPSVEASNRLAKFPWTNAVVIADPNVSEAKRLADQIRHVLGAVEADTNSMPWLDPRGWAVGVEVEITPMENIQQADLLVIELLNAGVSARRGWARKAPPGWMILRVGRNATREETRSREYDHHRMTNRFEFFQR